MKNLMCREKIRISIKIVKEKIGSKLLEGENVHIYGYLYNLIKLAQLHYNPINRYKFNNRATN